MNAELNCQFIDFLGVKKTYNGQSALSGVSLSIEKGSMNFLLGANGSGKSTLLKCLAGHEYWDSGDIIIAGKSRRYDSKDFNAGLHLVSEDVVPPKGTLSQLRDVYKAIFGSWDESVFQRVLRWGNLELSQNLIEVSRGQKIQGLLALTLACRPEILLIDEATAVLDPFIRSRLMIEIEEHHRSSAMTTIIATNIGTEIASLQGRLLIMKKGRVVVDRSDQAIADGFLKIRILATEIDRMTSSGFCFLEMNKDRTVSFIGKNESIANVSVSYLEDNRAISVDEIFIFYSDKEVT